MNQNKEMVSRVIAFDRNLHSVNIGACAPQPMTELMPILQDYFGNMTISSELVYGEKLLNGLKNGVYQLAILSFPIEDSDLLLQRYTEEQLYISVPEGHRLAKRNSVKFDDLKGEQFLLYQHIGFWKSVCEKYMRNTVFLIQPDRDSFYDLVVNTDYPAFSSNAVLAAEAQPDKRIYIPIDEEKAKYTYYIACLNKDRKKYSSFFNSVRSEVFLAEKEIIK